MKPAPEIQIVIHKGLIRFIHNDDLAEVMDLGKATTHRASYVEPGNGGWTAELSPVGGPVLGPFARRDAALAAEVQWLQQHLIPIPQP